MVLEGSEQESFGRNIFVGEKPVRLCGAEQRIKCYIVYIVHAQICIPKDSMNSTVR